jgi:hypothetical protein
VYCILWRYRVRSGHRARFQRAYGPRGPWVRLFRRAPGYLSTRLLADPAHRDVFFTLDFWRSVRAQRAALRRFRIEYRAIDAACARLTVREEKLAAWQFSGRA